MAERAIHLGEAGPPLAIRAWHVRLGFLLGALGPTLGFQIVVLLMLRFMTDSLAIPAVVAGAVLALTKVFDALADPMVGWASDSTRLSWGRRRPYFVLGAILLPLSTMAMFNLPHISETATVTVLAACLVMHSAGYSAFTVPYVAAASEITDDYQERSVLMSFRVYGVTLGIMLASTGAPWLLAYWGSGRAAHGQMALVMGGVMLATLVVALLLIPEPAHHAATEPKRNVLQRLADGWDNRPFRAVIMAHMGFMTGVGAVTVCTAYFSRQVLHLSDVWLGSFYLSKTLGNLVAVPLWIWLARRFEKKRAYLAALAAYGLFNLSWLWAGAAEPVVLVFARMFLIGAAMAGCVLMSSSIITDVIRYDTLRTGYRREGTFAGVASFVDKTFQAAGVTLVGSLLSAMGYVSSVHGAHVHQSGSAIEAIYIGFSAIPAAAALLCILAMLSYPLSAADFPQDR